MKFISSGTEIILTNEEEDSLKKALYILDKITCRISDNPDTDYYVNNELMACFNNFYIDINRIADFVMEK